MTILKTLAIRTSKSAIVMKREDNWSSLSGGVSFSHPRTVNTSHDKLCLLGSRSGVSVGRCTRCKYPYVIVIIHCNCRPNVVLSIYTFIYFNFNRVRNSVTLNVC